MFEFLADPFWQFFIGAFIAIVTIAISIVIYFKQRNRKKLSYEILSCTDILSTEENIEDDVQLSYKGKIVEDVKLLVLRIFNSGNLPVVSVDYEKPISIEFGKDTGVLTAEVIKKDPDNVQSTVGIEDHVITLYPALLNPGDSITIKMLVTKYEKELQVNSRIIGVNRIEMLHESPIFAMSLVVTFVALLIWGVGPVVWSVALHVPFFEAFSYLSILYFSLFVGSMILLLGNKSLRKGLKKYFEDTTKDRDAESDKGKCE